MINNVTKEMNEAGSEIANNLISAKCHMNFAGLGGCIDWDTWIKEENPPNQDLLLAYTNDEIDSVTAIYLAMERAK